MQPVTNIRQVVVLGAGYAGLKVVLQLSAACRRRKTPLEITLIDRSRHHQLVTLLHQSATEALPADRARLPLAHLVDGARVRLLQRQVVAIDAAARVVLTDEEAVPFDRLVIALGSETRFPDVPGSRHALPLRWWPDAEKLRQHVRQQFQLAAHCESADQRRQRLRIVVAGGGFTGCQLVGELCHWVTELADQYRVPIQDVHLVLTESQPRLLAGWEPRYGDYAAELFRNKAIDVRLGNRLLGVSPTSATLQDEALATCTTVWTGGIRAPSLLADSRLPVAGQGRVVVDDRLQVSGLPGLYACGDAAWYEKDSRPLPATAALAQQQGSYVARSLWAEIQGRPVPPYTPQELGMLVSLGGEDAVGELLGQPLRGLTAGLVKEGIERRYVGLITGRFPLEPPPTFRVR